MICNNMMHSAMSSHHRPQIWILELVKIFPTLEINRGHVENLFEVNQQSLLISLSIVPISLWLAPKSKIGLQVFPKTHWQLY